MYIVGTSGHIDHGKTSLIKALTGIDCDRLPEEKEREMTIDIGFSQIEYPKFGTVSIIDVPGHERFIRNMVAGAWGIDLALLVIAVDDSWMPQTEDHFRVIELLGIERMIVVLTKIDIADQEIIEIVEDDVRQKLQSTGYSDSDIVKVSSRTCAGLDELKEKIRENLAKLNKAADAGKPYLFVDRVFESKGRGTIITGTLKNGFLRETDEIVLLPGNRKTRIKKIESHYQSLNEGSPSQRTALNLHGVSVEELKRGDIIVKQNFFTESSDIIAGIKLLDISKEIKNNLGIEILVGTSAIKGKLILLEDSEKRGNEFHARIKFDHPWYFYPGESFIVTNPGGYRIVGGGKVLVPDINIIKNKKILKNYLKLFKGFSAKETIEFTIRIRQAVKKEEIKTCLVYSNTFIEKNISDLLKAGLVVQIGEYLADKDFYSAGKKRIEETIKNNVGLNIKEISDIAGLDQDIARILLPEVQTGYAVVEKDGKYFSGDSVTIDTLSEDKKKILSELKGKGAEGIDLNKINIDPVKKNMKELIRLGFAVSLDGNIIYHLDVYEALKKKIIDLFNTRDRISIADVREITNLSRKYLIPLLNRIESDGLIKRLGDFRIKV